MIALLDGQLLAREQDHGVLGVGGVGYLIKASRRTLDALAEQTGTVRVHTELVVREDAMTLYGFATPLERSWFRILTGVPGVGPALALSILSALDPESLLATLAAQDERTLTRISGVGKRLADRLITELRGKLPTAVPTRRNEPLLTIPTAKLASKAAQETISALQNLGFPPMEAERVVEQLLADHPDASMDTLFRLALTQRPN